MANYSNILAQIAAAITTNDNQEITGAVLREVLDGMVGALGIGYQYKGVATPATDPGMPDQKVFYLAGPGTYQDFDNITVPVNNLAVLKFNGSWTADLLANIGVQLVNNFEEGGTDKALTAEMGKELYEMFGIGYEAQPFFENSASAAWEAGNIQQGAIDRGYANRLLVLPLSQEVKEAGRISIRRGPSTTYTLGVFLSPQEQSGYTAFYTFNPSSNTQEAEITISDSQNYLALLLWDKPSDAEAKALDITVSYQAEVTNDPVLHRTDIADNYNGEANKALSAAKGKQLHDLLGAKMDNGQTNEEGFFVVDPYLNIGFKVTEEGVFPSFKGNPSSIIVAAANATDYDKSRADMVCSGVHDELVIMQALGLLNSCGEVILTKGTYSIDGFYPSPDGHMGAIIVPDTYRPNYRIKIAGAQDSDRDCILRISQTCYNNLAIDTQYSVFSAANHVFADYGKHVIFENLYVEVPGNKKQIICFDGWNFGSMRLTNCWANNAEAGSYLGSRLTSEFYGVAGCIGFRGTQGSNNAIDMIWTNCTAQGLGIGFAVSGEHLVMTQCAGVANKYAYTFNYYAQTTGAYTHPMTLINCCDERSENLPLFGNNGEPGRTSGQQAVTFIDFNIERLSTDAIVDLATELNPGSWRGSIDYSFQASYGGVGNTTDRAFWAAGSGFGVRSRNQAQLQAAPTNVRNSYAPNYYQQLYDTTLNKLAICVDPANKVWVDAAGNTV